LPTGEPDSDDDDDFLLESVELRKKEFADVVVMGAFVLRLLVVARVGSSSAACSRRLRWMY
jgi:hypothetical protein